MKATADDVRALLALMDRQYTDIREIEQQWGIFGAEGDFRPRIEYYHDAIRAFSAGETATGKHERLSAERLAYDAAMLRHIQAKPTTAGRGNQHLSAGTAVALAGQTGGSGDPDRETRAELKQLYKAYTVLFVTLLAEKADRNAETRSEEANTVVGDCALLKDLLAKLARGDIGVPALLAALDGVEHDELRRALKARLTKGKMSKDELGQAVATVGQAAAGAKTELAAIDKAMMNFATARLAVYEDSRDLVKGMAAKGMNIAGKFVESAMRQAQGQGRGM